MSKTISAALKAHLALRVTTIALCWQVTRVDGTTYYFTSHDQDLVVSGQTYRSTVGFSASPIQTGSTGEVDNLEVLGVFDDSAVIEQNIRNGLFDYASVSLFAVNWDDLSQGILRLRFGWLGEVTNTPTVAFLAELRGLTQALVQETGVEYSPICRADLGDSKCMIPIKPGGWMANYAFAANTFIQAATQSSDALLVAIFKATTAGTSGSSEPSWNTTIGGTTADGGVVWTCEPHWRVIGQVVSASSQKEFISTALSFPALPPVNATTAVQGVVSFRGPVAAGTEIFISDGIESHSLVFPFDTDQGGAANFFAIFVAGQTTWRFTITRSGSTFFFTNNSGQPGSITKANDTQEDVIIRNFTTNPLFGGTVTWISGQNAGRSMEVKYFDGTTFDITLWLSMYYPIQAGDRFFIYPGCDKTRNTCYFIFNNILNFRGEVDMPGLDTVLTYPSA